VLIEGPPDANSLIPLAADVGMVPLVALLVHKADDTTQAAFYPYAASSPEWIAMAHAAGAGSACRRKGRRLNLRPNAAIR